MRMKKILTLLSVALLSIAAIAVSAGQRVDKAQAKGGVFIVNGKKIVIKRA